MNRINSLLYQHQQNIVIFTALHLTANQMENAFLPYLEKLNINVNDLTRNYLITGCYWTEKGILHTKLGFKTLISILRLSQQFFASLFGSFCLWISTKMINKTRNNAGFRLVSLHKLRGKKDI